MLHTRTFAGVVLSLVVVLALVPLAAAQEPTPSVTVNDQPLFNNRVQIAQVTSNGPGWLVIHADQDGKPGPILGYSPVANGDNQDVTVTVNAGAATPTLYAMLHVDAGQIGNYEFPGADAPAKAGDQVVTPPFNLTGRVIAADQALVDSRVTIDLVSSEGPGWLVIHADNEGNPGAILGYSPVQAGENSGVVVAIDGGKATETLYAMLHTDAGEIGTYEFPSGPDVPAQAEGQMISPAFKVTGGM